MTAEETPEPSEPTEATSAREHRGQRWVVFVSAIMAQTGIQLIVPALPVLQQDLGISDSQISLVTSVYLFPSVLAALAGGVLTQRLGRRRVFTASMLLYGVAGTAVPLVAELSFGALLVARVLQGVGFAGILPMTITVLGDLFRGPAQVTVQGQRSLAMQLGDSALPVIGGVLAGLSWLYPFIGPVLALPLALVIWRTVDDRDGSPKNVSTRDTMVAMARFSRDPGLLAIQVAGFVRFLLKFMVLTYVPILAVNERGIAVVTIGLALGLATLLGGVAAVLAGWMLRYVRFSRLVNLSLLMYSGCLFGIALSTSTVWLIAMVITYGVADGLYGVLQSGVAADAVDRESRAAFIYATGAIRNLGKFVAPVAIAGVALIGTLTQGFIIGGVVALLAIATGRPLRRYDVGYVA